MGEAGKGREMPKGREGGDGTTHTHRHGRAGKEETCPWMMGGGGGRKRHAHRHRGLGRKRHTPHRCRVGMGGRDTPMETRQAGEDTCPQIWGATGKDTHPWKSD